MTIENLLDAAERVRDILIRAVEAQQNDWGGLDENAPEYRKLRQLLRSDPRSRGCWPELLADCRSPEEALDYMNNVSPCYGNRIRYDRYVYDQFRPFFSTLEELQDFGSPLQRGVSDKLAEFEVDQIFEAWGKMMERRISDPSGAITAARTLIETVCHHIVQENGLKSEEYDLEKLYKTAARCIKLDADEYKEQVFKKILSGCYSVISGLASLRNDLGDAHGKSRMAARANPRHAELAVNMAATMAGFMLETWQQRKQSAIQRPPE